MIIKSINVDYNDMGEELPYTINLEVLALGPELENLQNMIISKKSLGIVETGGLKDNFSDEEIIEALKSKYPHKFI